jgi:hypothetical protein
MPRGAYEASIPLVMAQIDGLTLDITNGRKFFGTRKRDVRVDNRTLATLEDSLPVVRELFSTDLNVSAVGGSFGRHGIMHGRELGYATRVNSVKTFVLLQAVTEWAQSELTRREGQLRSQRLKLAAGTEGALARLNLTQRERKLYAKAARELTAQGVTVTTTEPRYYGDGPRVLDRLRAADAPTGQALTPEEHSWCPGHVAHIEVTIYEPDPDEDNGDGAGEQAEVLITYGCADPAAHGHLDLWGSPSQDRVRTVHLPDEDVPPGEDEQARTERLARQEQARAEAQARAEQAARAARRELIRLNKEADAAQGVRREFLRSCLTAKSWHKQMTGYALQQLLGRDRTVSEWFNDHPSPGGQPPVLADILGEDPIHTALAAPANRHPVMLWAYVAAAHEKDMPRDAHRQRNTARADYLRHLTDLGYTPADVERRIITAVNPDTEPTTDADPVEVMPESAA